MAPTQYDEKPKPGDLIEIFRGPYQHWALYVGNGFVIHLTSANDIPGTSANSMMSSREEKAIVKREKLRGVVKKNKWKINNTLDKEYKPRSVDVILKEAKERVGLEMHYSVRRGNCEHFVNNLRYGRAKSRQGHQVEVAMITGVVAVVAVAIVGVVKGVFLAVAIVGVVKGVFHAITK